MLSWVASVVVGILDTGRDPRTLAAWGRRECQHVARAVRGGRPAGKGVTELRPAVTWIEPLSADREAEVFDAVFS